jgi:hypothetical protein
MRLNFMPFGGMVQFWPFLGNSAHAERASVRG